MSEHADRLPCPRCGADENFGHHCDLDKIVPGLGQSNDWPTPLAYQALRDLAQGFGHRKNADAWKTRDDREDMSHAEVHSRHYWSDDYPDYDPSNDGALHLTADIQRRMFVLERRLMRDANAAKLTPKHDNDGNGA